MKTKLHITPKSALGILDSIHMSDVNISRLEYLRVHYGITEFATHYYRGINYYKTLDKEYEYILTFRDEELMTLFLLEFGDVVEVNKY